MITYIVEVAGVVHAVHAETICRAIEEAAAARGTGIARRNPEYIETKMREGKAVIAFARDNRTGEDAFAGFCYIETWSNKRYVANSGLIVVPEHRHGGLALRIKLRVFELSRERYPQAKIFGITTSHAVMKINTVLGYVPVPFSELTADEEFWTGCRSCPNFDILNRTNRAMCLCTGMIYDPDKPHPHVAIEVRRQLGDTEGMEVAATEAVPRPSASSDLQDDGEKQEEVAYA